MVPVKSRDGQAYKMFAILKKRSFFLCIAVLLSLAMPSVIARGDARADKIEASLAAQVEAWNAGDMERFMDGYIDSPDLTYVTGAEIIKGFAALKEHYIRRYGKDGRFSKDAGSLAFSKLSITPLEKRHALVRGRWHLDRAGQEKLQGVFTLIMVEVDGSWKILHDHSST